LKNTVSIYNDYLKAFDNYTLTADVYSLESKLIASYKKSIKVIPEDAVLNNLITIDFNTIASPVHFIKLRLLNEAGKEVSSSFYWRSTDKYTGKTSNSGPAAGGFAPLSTMKKVALSTKYSIAQKENKTVIAIDLKNTTKSIAFFTQLQLLDELNRPVRPSFYTDNFFSLLPGEKKQVTIETFGLPKPLTQYHLVVKGYNVNSEIINLVNPIQK